MDYQVGEITEKVLYKMDYQVGEIAEESTVQDGLSGRGNSWRKYLDKMDY